MLQIWCLYFVYCLSMNLTFKQLWFRMHRFSLAKRLQLITSALQPMKRSLTWLNSFFILTLITIRQIPITAVALPHNPLSQHQYAPWQDKLKPIDKQWEIPIHITSMQTDYFNLTVAVLRLISSRSEKLNNIEGLLAVSILLLLLA